jgi:endonuclease G
MPNNDDVENDPWQKYIVSTETVERATGYRFFSNLPQATQDALETKVDTGRAPGRRRR